MAPTWCERNHAAVDRALAALHRVEIPGRVTTQRGQPALVPADAPEFVRRVTAEMMAGRGDDLPVSALPVDGTYPSGTTAFEKRNVSDLVAEWDPDLCIQCGNCSFVCPHSVIRSRFYDEAELAGAPDSFPSSAAGRPRAARHPLHAAGLRGGLHRMRAVRGGLPGDRARRARRGRRSTWCRGNPWWPGSGRTSRSSRRCRSTTGPGWTSARCAVPSSCSRCSSSPAPAPAAARPRTSRCCPSCSAIA